MLGFDEYVKSYTNGLQILRYNKTTAYIPHMDWIDDPGRTNSHDFHPEGSGTNRYATVLLYMTNLADNDGRRRCSNTSKRRGRYIIPAREGVLFFTVKNGQ